MDAEDDATAERLGPEGGVVVSSAEKTLVDSRQALAQVSIGQSASSAAVDAARYEDLGEIAHGGMGTVRRVFDRVLLRTVALKTLRVDVGRLGQADRFVEEAQITGQLDHPNIVPVYDFGVTTDGRAFFTMKLVHGQTLSERIRALHAHGFDGEALEAVMGVLIKVCEAVSFAHSRRVVHRDLKPANVMIGSHGQVYVMDWGLGLLRAFAEARRGGTTPTPPVLTAPVAAKARARIEGTVAYMAPEQAMGREDLIDERTDVFGLGAMLYEALTNRPPYPSKGLTEGLDAARSGRVRPPEEMVTQALPPGLCEIAACAMRVRPSERYQSAEAMGAELAGFLRGGGWFATRVVADGEIVMREGDAADAAYVILDGRCEVYRETHGRRDVIRSLGPGDVFGETALLSARPRTASVVAAGRAIVKVITGPAFEREMSRSTWLAAIVRQLAGRFAELESGASTDAGGF